MSSNLPIVRDNRVRDRLAAVGQTVFTFDAPLFDSADLKVFVKTPASAYFLERTTGFVVALLPGNLGGTVTFAAPLVEEGSSALVFVRLQGARVHNRLLDVTRGGIVQSRLLEAELDRQTLVLQELRRDFDAIGDASQTASVAADIATGAAALASERASLSEDAAGAASTSAAAAAGSATTAAQIAAQMAEFGVTSFKGRTGEVLPIAGDYTAADVGAVPTGRKLKVGSGLFLDGIAGSDAEPVIGDLSGDRTISLNLVGKALTSAIWTAGADTTEAPISPVKLKAAAAALSGGLATMQSVTNVTGSRAFGTVYQNGGKVRMFSINASGNGSFTIGFGPTSSILGVKGTTVSGSLNLHLFVPPWWFYGVTASSGITSYAWWEAE